MRKGTIAPSEQPAGTDSLLGWRNDLRRDAVLFVHWYEVLKKIVGIHLFRDCASDPFPDFFQVVQCTVGIIEILQGKQD